jgi:hypothetical protein
MRFTRKAFFPASVAEPVIPEANQQVRAQPHPFPADKHQQIVVGEYQNEHGRHEQIQVGEKAGIARIAMHVANGIHVHQKTDPAHHKEHNGTERVDQKRHVGSKRPGKDPGVQFGVDRLMGVPDHPQNDNQCQEERQANRPDP